MTTLDAIRQRVEAATPGPWKRSGTPAKPHWYVAAPDVLVHGPALIREPDTVQETVDRWVSDAAFIAAARTDVPLLLAVAEAAAAFRVTTVLDADPEVLIGGEGWDWEGHRVTFIRQDELDALRAALSPLLTEEAPR